MTTATSTITAPSPTVQIDVVDAALTAPVPTILIDSVDAVLVAPAATLQVTIAEAALTAPAPVLVSNSFQPATVALIAPRATLTSIALSGSIATAAVTSPSPALTSEQISVELTAPVPTLESTSLTGTLASVAVSSKPFLLTSEAINPSVQQSTLVPKSPTLTSIALTGTIATALLTSRRPTLISTAAAGQTATAALAAPTPLLSSGAVTGVLATAFLTAPRIILSSSVSQALSSFVTWCMNVESPGLTNYTNFDFHSLVQLGNVYLGADENGFYALAGSDDAGTAIPATLRFGFTDFESPQLKRVPAVYLSGRFGGKVNLLIKVDGEDTEWAYPLDPIETNLKNHLIKPGRGLESRYWQFGLSNVLGSDFELDVFDIAEQILSRRVG